MSKPLVSILSITYNHEKYVAQALESFVMQQTDFDYEVIIADDASPDNTQAVIQKYANKYPELIKPILRENNLGMNSNSLDALSRCQGKYIAICEGDDYWTDPYKLQKQVDFLEENEDCSMVIHDHIEVPYRPEKSVNMKLPTGYLSAKDVIDLRGRSYATSSYVIRKSVVVNLPSFMTDVPVGDYFFMLLSLTKGRVYYIDEALSAYRRIAAESWSAKSRDLDWYKAFYKKMIRSLDAFDEYSGYKYHALLVSRKRRFLADYIKAHAARNRIKMIYLLVRHFFTIPFYDVLLIIKKLMKSYGNEQ